LKGRSAWAGRVPDVFAMFDHPRLPVVRLEFESTLKADREYAEIIDELSVAPSPTIWVALTPLIAQRLDNFCTNKRQLAVVMLGDFIGMRYAMETVRHRTFWVPPFERSARPTDAGFAILSPEQIARFEVGSAVSGGEHKCNRTV